ncbi:glycosyltransferase family 4 protein [uncultured Tateyamaria sp.]|uniref:glycosyltransferase family 4 protein n=1 Tax=uncultured Tateyamaria sp. TaxID=455651 RepID=UPI00260732C3|nr:glycosyltransferase family 4 protein [uncultured Tateyamaria sp.]
MVSSDDTVEATPVTPQHVVVIASLAWSLVNFRLELMRRMLAQGHHVTALAPDFDPDTRAQLQREGITCHSVPMQRTGLNPLADLRTLRAISQLLSALRPDVVVGYTMKPILYGCWAGHIAGVPRRYALFTGLGYAFSKARPRGRRRLVRAIVVALHRMALRHVTAAFCYNRQERRDIRSLRLIPDNVPLVDVPGSGVDTRRFAPPTEAPAQFRFLFVGRLLKSKGLEVLAEAARLLRARGHKFELGVLGPLDTNPDAIPLAQVEQWQAEGLLTYLGETRDVRPHLASAGVFVLPTMLREGVPRTILEAMASGLPVITTDAPGCGETIEDGVSGRVVPCDDASALATAMAQFIADPALAQTMGQAAHERVIERYDVHKVNALLLTNMGLEAPCVAHATAPATPLSASVESVA